MRKCRLRYLKQLGFVALTVAAGCSGAVGGTSGEASHSNSGSPVVSLSQRSTALSGLNIPPPSPNRALLAMSLAQARRYIRTSLPSGTRIYLVPSYDVSQGTTAFGVIGPITRTMTSNGLTITDRYGNVYNLDRTALVTPNKDGVEMYFRPGAVVDRDLAGVAPIETTSSAVR